MSRGLRSWARGLERDVHALYLAARDPRVPWYTNAAAFCVAAYALSPIDLVPDFVPVLGYLDDLVVVPLIPPEILAEHRAAAARRDRPILVASPYRGLVVSDYIRKYGQDAIAGVNFAGAGVGHLPFLEEPERFDRELARFAGEARG